MGKNARVSSLITNVIKEPQQMMPFPVPVVFAGAMQQNLITLITFPLDEICSDYFCFVAN